MGEINFRLDPRLAAARCGISGGSGSALTGKVLADALRLIRLDRA